MELLTPVIRLLIECSRVSGDKEAVLRGLIELIGLGENMNYCAQDDETTVIPHRAR
jgi:hypothetical protein